MSIVGGSLKRRKRKARKALAKAISSNDTDASLPSLPEELNKERSQILLRRVLQILAEAMLECDDASCFFWPIFSGTLPLNQYAVFPSTEYYIFGVVLSPFTAEATWNSFNKMTNMVHAENPFAKMMVATLGGVGRALEVCVKIAQKYPTELGKWWSDTKQQLSEWYGTAPEFPLEMKYLVQLAVANVRVNRNDLIPNTETRIRDMEETGKFFLLDYKKEEDSCIVSPYNFINQLGWIPSYIYFNLGWRVGNRGTVYQLLSYGRSYWIGILYHQFSTVESEHLACPWSKPHCIRQAL